MSRYNEKKLTYAEQDKMLDMFCETLARLKTKEQIYKFLKDILNRQERLMIVRRLLIAKELLNDTSYKAIKKNLRCGEATIARIQRWVNFGRGGYKKAIEVIKNYGTVPKSGR